ncbi:hypothetical protein J1605_001375 [Eschrichtius robustus]|uniref:Uncharacterized protein n=1 Tax=Eschrichtius robustus TaxID=9764 RepID=A0AB34I433_ESCRO|nr:hypothetical protein J1605_001375 [Eschrichtius robustus]
MLTYLKGEKPWRKKAAGNAIGWREGLIFQNPDLELIYQASFSLSRGGANRSVPKGNISSTVFAHKHRTDDKKGHHSQQQRSCNRASLVAQWLRIRLPIQGTRVQALVQEDPTCHGATKPVRHND